MLTHVTFTGWDRRTDLVDLRRFLCDYAPATIEIAVLASATRAGEDRYPRSYKALEILSTAHALGQQTAVHFCGRLARMLLSDTADFFSEHPADAEIIDHADRIQVNVPEGFWPVKDGATDYTAAAKLSHRLGKVVIVQTRAAAFPEPVSGVDFLFDRSSGTGTAPAEWPSLFVPGHRAVGYAGGLSPVNVAAALADIMTWPVPQPQYPPRSFWLDMESGIREDIEATASVGEPESRVSISACRAVMQAVAHMLPEG